MKLDIQLFASGTINGSSTASNCDCRITWSSTGNTSTNSSSVTANIQIYRSGSSSTTGTFSGSLTINGTKTSISKKFSPYNWGTWATVGSATVNVKHNSDGTKSITIKGSVSNTGTSMAGTYSASGTAVLNTLHKAPDFDLDDLSFTETNQKLLNIEIPNYTFVKNLSQIKVEVSDNVVYYDDAEFSKLILYEPTIYEGEYNKYIELNTNPATFTPKKSAFDNLLNAKLYDTKNASSTMEDDVALVFNMIDYSLVTINGSVKRNGQTSGLVTLNCNGTYYNGVVGNIDHSLSSYKPTISYKFYEVGHEEDAIVGLIPSSSITTNNGTFSVSNLEIGSTSTSASNYFDYEKAYRVVIAVQDDYIDGNNNQYYFSSATTSELSISVGEATWTEFRDRVDFKAITIKNVKTAYYPGDTIELGSTTSGYLILNGCITGGTKTIFVTIPLSRKLIGITTITPVSVKVEARGINGYLNFRDKFNEYVGDSDYTVTAVQTEGHDSAITLSITKPTGFTNTSNNTIIQIGGYFKFNLS